jgi:hypothetical protein
MLVFIVLPAACETVGVALSHAGLSTDALAGEIRAAEVRNVRRNRNELRYHNQKVSKSAVVILL